MSWFRFAKEKAAVVVREGPPPATAWAQLIEANRQKRAEYEARKQAELDRQAEERKSIWRRTRVH